MGGLGCAAGLPTGARSSADAFHWLTPAAAPRLLPDEVAPAGPVLSEGSRARAVASARRYLTPATPIASRFGTDCTSLVRAVYDDVAVNVFADAEPSDNGVTAIYRFAQARGRVFTGGHPLPGDLVFFRNTYDRNEDGRDNDGLTHVGLVDAVDSDETVWVIHRVQRGVVRYRMNLRHPEARIDPRTGVPVNDYLRAAGGGRPAVLTAQLFAAYATLFVADPLARTDPFAR